MDKVRVQDEDTLGSGSGSNISDLDILNATETDDLGRRILAHQRESQQAKKENRRPFFRARPRPRTTDPVLTLGGIGSTSAGVGAGPNHQRTVSEGSNISDIPLNVPREWGKRIRKRGEWRRNYESDGESKDGALHPVKLDETSIFPHRTLYTGDEHPILSPGGVRASVGTTLSPMHKKRQMSSPSSLHHMNTTLGPALDSQDVDFNDASVLISTPAPAAVSSHNRLIDKLMKEDVELAEKKDTTERIRTRSSERPGSAPSGDVQRLARRRSSRLSDKENEPVDEAPAHESSLNARKGSHSRGDSIALLRKLARVSSLSPSPGKGKSEPDFLQSKPKNEYDSAERESKLPGARNTGNDNFSAAKVTTARERLEQRRVRIQDEKARKEEALEARAASQEENMVQNTPRVTGGWVDTPAKPEDEPKTRDLVGQDKSKQPLASKKDPRRVLSEPSHPKSALEAVMQDARLKRDPQLGDSTIASLEDIVNPNLDPTNSTVTQDIAPATTKEGTLNDGDLTQAEIDRLREDIALENLNKRLRSTRTTIKDANRGLRRIENRIEAADSKAKVAKSDTEKVTYEVIQGNDYRWPRHLRPYAQPHNGRTICEHCGGSYTSVWGGLWTEFRELFWVYTGPDHDKLRLTWIGWSIVGWLIWFTIESTLADSDFNRYKIDAFFPFVIPTILLKPFAPMLTPVADGVHWLLVGNPTGPPLVKSVPKPGGTRRTMADSMAETIVGDRAWLKTAAEATATATRRIVGSAGDALDQAGRIWDDEFL